MSRLQEGAVEPRQSQETLQYTQEIGLTTTPSATKRTTQQLSYSKTHFVIFPLMFFPPLQSNMGKQV